jgi:hypothetical protein
MRSRRERILLRATAAIAILYLLAAYVVLPRLWAHYEHQPGLAALPAVTRTTQGIPGGPLNVGLVGDKPDVILAMTKTGWHPADPITLESSIGIAASVILDRRYNDAPVSTLLYEGRKQDLAFEQLIGESADRRNHVRLWKVLEKGKEGRPVWLGSATLDRGVGFSAYTGQITHHIAPDVDAERGKLIGELVTAGIVTELYNVEGVGPTFNGRNGEGDWYYTDGEIRIAVISPGALKTDQRPVTLADPPLVQLKDGLWAQATGTE